MRLIVLVFRTRVKRFAIPAPPELPAGQPREIYFLIEKEKEKKRKNKGRIDKNKGRKEKNKRVWALKESGVVSI